MPVINKPLLRLAVAIRAQLAASSSRARLIDLPVHSWQRCVELVRQIRRAELRGWHLAAAELLMDLRYTIPSVESELAALLRELPPTTLIESVATTSDIYQDLVALGEEFEEVAFDLRGRWLSVTTEPIELEGIYLGPFEIRLDWGRPAERRVTVLSHYRQGSPSVRVPRERHASARAGRNPLRRRRAAGHSPGACAGATVGFLYARGRRAAQLQPRKPVCRACRVVRPVLLRLWRGRQ